MNVGMESLGRTVTARYADGTPNFTGKQISYCDAPTVGIERPDGTQANWRPDMCVVEPTPEEVAVAAERERCAAIAEYFCSDHAEQIAAGIRSGKPVAK